MSGLFRKNKPMAAEPPSVGGLRIQTSAYGMPIFIVYGKTRVAGNLLWYGDFVAIAHTETQSSGGKGGGGDVETSTTSYTYQAAVAIGLCEGPIIGIANVWVGKAQASVAALGIGVFPGSNPQTPWTYLTTNHAGQDLAYANVCYVAASSYTLTGDGSLPNHSFELDALFQYGGGIVDANPKDILNDVLTNVDYGALFPVSKMGSLTPYSQYCVASGLFLSSALTEQRPAQEIITQLTRLTNTGLVWSEGLLKVIPYGDTAVTGNGQTYTPNLIPEYDLGDSDFLTDGSTDPVVCRRTSPSDAYNAVQVEFTNRANQYNPEPAEAKDQAAIDRFGLRPMDTVKAPEICDIAPARAIAQLLLQRALYIRNTYEFKLGWKYCRLEPMDLVTITDVGLGLSLYPVRIIEISEDEDGMLSVKAEDFPAGTSHSAAYPSQVWGGYSANYNIPAGNVSAPAIFNAPGVVTVSGYEAWIAIGSTNADYGGCEVWASTDNATYKLVGVLNGSSRYGVLTAVLADSADPDTINTCAVDLTTSHGALLGGTQQDADLFNTLSLVGSELISFQSATLTAAYKYNLATKLRRGVYGSPRSSHAIGDRFVRLDQAIFRFVYDPTIVIPGQTIYFKFLSFNHWGGGRQLLSGVSSYSFVVGASLSSPPTVGGFAVSQNGNVVVFQWSLLNPQTNPNIAGYEIRANPIGGSTAWNDGTPVTQVTRGTQITTAKVPPGNWYFMICARDDSQNYSKIPAIFTLRVTNTFDLILNPTQHPDWRGALTNFVRHWTGKLIPDDQKIVAGNYDNFEWCDTFVPTPYATCTYEAPELDIGFDDSSRVWGDIESVLGPGVVSGIADPQLQIDYRTQAGAYDGFENWGIGTLTLRYCKQRFVLDTARGKCVINKFTPTVDAEERTQSGETVTVAAGGSVITFPVPFHLVPTVSAQMLGTSALFPTIANITATGFTANVWNTTNSSVGGIIRYDATGV